MSGESQKNKNHEIIFSDPEDIKDGMLLAGSFANLLSKVENPIEEVQVLYEDLISERQAVLSVDNESRLAEVYRISDRGEPEFIARTYSAGLDGKTMFEVNPDFSAVNAAGIIEKLAENLSKVA